MRFKDILNEKWAGMTKRAGVVFDYYVNPDKTEIKKILRDSPFRSIRFGAVDKSNGDVYAWRGDILHYTMKKEEKLPFDFGFYYEEDPKFPNLKADAPENWKYYANLKNRKTILKKIRKMFPREKVMNILASEKADDKKYPDGVYDLKTGKYLRPYEEEEYYL